MCVFSPHLFSQRFHFVHFFPSSKAMISQVGVTPGAWKPSLPAAPFAVGDLGDSPIQEIAWISGPSLEVKVVVSYTSFRKQEKNPCFSFPWICNKVSVEVDVQSTFLCPGCVYQSRVKEY